MEMNFKTILTFYCSLIFDGVLFCACSVFTPYYFMQGNAHSERPLRTGLCKNTVTKQLLTNTFGIVLVTGLFTFGFSHYILR